MEDKKTVKLFSKNRKTIGQLITLPLVGDVQFDQEDNSITIEEDKVSDLLKLDFGIKLSTSKVDETPTINTKIESKDDSSKSLEEDENTLKMLKSLNEVELKELTLSYPDSSECKTKSSLIKFLFNKIRNK